MRSLTIGHFIRRYRYVSIRKLSRVVWILAMLEMKQFPKIIGLHFVIITLRQWYNRGRLQQPCSCTKQFPLIIAVLINESRKELTTGIVHEKQCLVFQRFKVSVVENIFTGPPPTCSFSSFTFSPNGITVKPGRFGTYSLSFCYQGRMLNRDGRWSCIIECNKVFLLFWSVGKVRDHEILAKRSKVNGLQFPVRNALFKDGGFGASRLHSTAQWSDKTI